MGRVLYITTYPIKEIGDGISNKIKSQVRAMELIGHDVDWIFRTDAGIAYKISGVNSEIGINGRWKYLFFMKSAKLVEGYGGSYDYIYIRNPHGGLYSLFLSVFLKRIRKINSVVVLEIPHYPYEDEGKSFMDKVANAAHKISRRFFLRYIDKIVYMGPVQHNIWGRTAVRIVNSVDLAMNRPVNKSKGRGGNISFVGVAALAYWHGYDRLIMGINDYVKNKENEVKVDFHIVGDGEPELSYLRDLVSKYQLEDYVVFYGRKTGDELDEIYDEMDIGVDSLGRHRSGNNYNCSIKSKEYASRNLPFIKSHLDDSFNDVNFVYNVSADDEATKLDDIINWYESLDVSETEIRSYAVEFFSMEKQIRKSLCK